MKILRILFLAAIAVILLADGSIAQEATTPSSRSLVIEGVKNQVTVRKDSRAIPYIEASTKGDLYFVQGFVTASDRLWQMDLYRRVASGRTAELFGNVTLEEDKRWRRFGFRSIVEKSFEGFSQEYKDVLENYARGVNAYIATLDKDSLPAEFRILQYTPETWKATDSLLIGKILADALSTSWHEDAMKAKFTDLPKEKFDQLFIEKTPFDVLVVGKDLGNLVGKIENEYFEHRKFSNLNLGELADAAVRERSLSRIGFYQEFNAASNNWVISGKRTLDGKPILANDPHLDSSAPSIWYLSHLSTPSGRVSGVTVPGVPGIILGHNENFAWGATNLGPDVQDVFIETFNDKNQHKTTAGWSSVKSRTEEIKVRKNMLSPDSESVAIEILETDDGVVIRDNGDTKTVLRWTALDPTSNEFEAFYRLNYGKNWNDFKSALKTYGGATQNFIYADIKGNIGFHNGGKIPIRSSGDGSLPYDGSTEAGKWSGYVPFEELPSSYNPSEGFIITANQRLTGDSYKHFLGRSFADPYRARRILQLVQANSKMTINDSADIQRDIFSISYSDFAREIVKLNAASPETINILKGWDGKTSSDSKAAILILEIRRAFLKEILMGTIGPEKTNSYRWSMQNSFIDWLIREKPAAWLPKNFPDYSAVLKSSEIAAREALTKKLGPDESKWVYGKNSKFAFRHPLAQAPLIGSLFATDSFDSYGGFSTPNVGSAVSMRHLTMPGEWDQTRQGIPLGQSGDPKSLHFKDQFAGWRSGSTPVFPFSSGAIEAATREILIINGK